MGIIHTFLKKKICADLILYPFNFQKIKPFIEHISCNKWCNFATSFNLSSGTSKQNNSRLTYKLFLPFAYAVLKHKKEKTCFCLSKHPTCFDTSQNDRFNLYFIYKINLCTYMYSIHLYMYMSYHPL